MADAARLEVDGGIPNQLVRVVEAAGALDQEGHVGAEHTSRLELGTNIAVAFARDPMIVANVGWDLQTYSRGRLNLGLGTQIRPYIEKRFSMPWSHPAPRMREFASAPHAIWSAWKDGTELRFESGFHTHKVMTPMFTPSPRCRAKCSSSRGRTTRNCKPSSWSTGCCRSSPSLPRPVLALHRRRFACEHNHHGRFRQAVGGSDGVHRRAAAACGADSSSRQRAGVVG